MFQMLGNMGGELKVFKYVSLYSLLPTDKIASGLNDFWLPVIVLLGIAIILSIIGCYHFKKEIYLFRKIDQKYCFVSIYNNWRV